MSTESDTEEEAFKPEGDEPKKSKSKEKSV